MRANAGGVQVQIAELSDAGRDPTKQVNEDSVGSALTAVGPLCVVCDGMGGHSGGQTASRTAVSTIIDLVQRGGAETSPPELLREAIERASQAVYTLGGQAPTDVRPGSTCVAVIVSGREAHVAHVGDSRVYLVRNGQSVRLTRDHSLVEEMVDAGVISRGEAARHPDANKITRALGIQPRVEVELGTFLLDTHDVLVLCSDGLTDLVSDTEIAEAIGATGSVERACEALVALANQRGGFDNITVQLLLVEELADKSSGPSPTLTDVRGKPPAATKTLVDAAPPSLREEHDVPRTVGDPRANRTHTTVPDPTLASPQRTLIDEPERLTEPALGRPAARQTSRQISWVLVVSAVIAGLVVTLAVLWWVIGSLRAHTSPDDAPPPMPSERTPAPRASSNPRSNE